MKNRFARLAGIQRRGPARPGVRRRRAAVALLLAGLVMMSGALLWHHLATAVPDVAYSRVAAALERGDAESVLVADGGAHVEVTLDAPMVVDGEAEAVVGAAMPRGALELADLERWSRGGTEVRVQSASARGGGVGGMLLMILAVGGAIFLVVRMQQRQGSRRFRSAAEERHLTLSDVGGAHEAQADLRDLIAFLKDPERFRAMGAKCPRGVLLVGPPGTGKTLLARAVAGESGRPVIVASGSEFTEMFVGVGARRVRDLAKQARERAPCIVFIDEFDSIGGRRGRPNRSGEEETTLNQLLVEMDGLSGNEGVVWMAATNRDDMLDPAVRRPGRFDRVVEVALPTAADRLDILRIHAGKRPLGRTVDLQRLAALTIGYSGAELESLLNEAAIFAVHAEAERIEMEHVDQARDRMQLGRVRAGVTISADERRLVAVHEAGHVVAALLAVPEDRLHKVTIEARGRSLGAAHFAPDADRHLYSRRYLEGTLVKALGGRAAELVFFGPDGVTSGAGADLVYATRVARQMVAEFGMSDEVGLISAAANAQDGAPSGRLQGEIDGAVRALIARQVSRAEELIRAHQGAVTALAAALIERDVLDADEVYEIAAAHGVAAPEGALAA